jgi:hypothetical protein
MSSRTARLTLALAFGFSLATASLAIAQTAPATPAAPAAATMAPAKHTKKSKTATAAAASPVTPASSAAMASGSQFSTVAAAQAHCPTDTVVWSTMSKSKSYHLATSKYFGKTKHGAYACEKDLTTAGFHAAKS